MTFPKDYTFFVYSGSCHFVQVTPVGSVTAPRTSTRFDAIFGSPWTVPRRYR
ncbi:MAG: hypothetical protein ABJA16_14680 [Nakamurella sp.]